MKSRKTKKGDVFNIGGRKTCKVGETLKYLVKLSNLRNIKIKTEEKRLRPIDADLQVPDTRKFNKTVKWKRKFSYEDTMLDLLNFWRDKINASKYNLVR